jgi:cobaltochelatase CobS
MARRPAPTASAREADPNRIVSVEWTPFTLDEIPDVRLYRATFRNADGDEVKPHGVPRVDPSYVMREDLLREVAWAIWPHDNAQPEAADDWTACLLAGPRGSGKTSLVLQLAARCNVPVFRTNLTVGTTVRHLKGRVGAQEGRTVFVPGVATMAMEATAAWLLLDEVTGCAPPVALSLFPVLEPDGAVLLEDAQPPRYVRRSPYFRVFCTDNVLGWRMEEQRHDYSGTNADQNVALLDRIGSTVHVPYMTFEQEHKAISAAVPTIDGMVLSGLIHVATKVRQQGQIVGGMSLRMMINWARRCAAGRLNGDGTATPWETVSVDDQWVIDCARGAFIERMSSKVDADAIEEIIRHTFGTGAGNE